MWGNGAAAMALARQALAEAGEAKTLSTVLVTKLEGHLVACGRNNELQNAAQIARDLDSREWRLGLGKRLDRQDKLMWSALVGVLLIAFTVIGFLVEHSGLFAAKG